eukprot:3294939-Amphidinium_carterae.1
MADQQMATIETALLRGLARPLEVLGLCHTGLQWAFPPLRLANITEREINQGKQLPPQPTGCCKDPSHANDLMRSVQPSGHQYVPWVQPKHLISSGAASVVKTSCLRTRGACTNWCVALLR